MTGIAGAGIAIRGIGLIQRLGALVERAIDAHPLAVLAALSLMLNGWQWHEAGVAARHGAARMALWHRSFGAEQAAFTSLRASYDTLRGAVTDQNASVEALAQASDARARAAATALASARNRAATLTALSARLVADAASRPVGATPCPTPAAVLAARGQM